MIAVTMSTTAAIETETPIIIFLSISLLSSGLSSAIGRIGNNFDDIANNGNPIAAVSLVITPDSYNVLACSFKLIAYCVSYAFPRVVPLLDV